MGLIAEFEITCEGLPFVEVAAAVPEATVEVEFQPSDEWYTAFVVGVVEGPAERVEDTFESVSFVDEYTRFERDDETPWYRVEPAVSMPTRLGPYVDDVEELQAMAAADARIDRTRATPTGWVQRGWFADRAALDRFRSYWQRNGEFRLRRLVPSADGDADAGLTPPQREALRTAYEMGYFEIPRTASLAEVAAKLDITASSLSERLRRAQTHLVESTVAAPDPSTL